MINETAQSFFKHGEARRCCYARSGPIVYASVPIPRPPVPSDWSFYHGSQWMVLAREAASWLVRDARAAAFARHVRLTYMADETYVQSALMASPHRSKLVNHNLRYIDWPHGYGDPNVYYHTVGSRHWAGPMVLNEALFESVVGSPALFARKVDLEDPGGVAFMRRWDAWMSAKRIVERARDGDGGGGRRWWRGGGGGGGDAPSPEELSAARELLSASPRQPAIAEPLLEADANLASVAPPPTEEELARLGAEEAALRASPRSTHFGHEDLMGQQMETPPEADARGDATQPQTVHEFDAAAPWQPWADDDEHGDEESSAGAAPRLAEVVFTDGSRCSCRARCGAADEPECCAAWEAFPACGFAL